MANKTLIVTNDFPPRPGGIQAFVHGLASRRPPGSVVVYAPRWKGCEEFDTRQPYEVVRHPSTLMLPTRAVAGRAAALVEDGATVVFGAAAPLGLLAPALRAAGAARIVMLTHGHEASWARLPGARGMLRRIGAGADVVTYLGEYTRRLLAPVIPAPGSYGSLRAWTPKPSAPARAAGGSGRRSAWATGRWSSASPGWCPARDRTCCCGPGRSSCGGCPERCCCWSAVALHGGRWNGRSPGRGRADRW